MNFTFLFFGGWAIAIAAICWFFRGLTMTCPNCNLEVKPETPKCPSCGCILLEEDSQ